MTKYSTRLFSADPNTQVKLGIAIRTLDVSQTPFVDFRNPRQCPNILAVLGGCGDQQRKFGVVPLRGAVQFTYA